MLKAIYEFEVARPKKIHVSSLEELVNRFIKYKWLRLDVELDTWTVSIANNSFIAWEWYEYIIESPDYSGDWSNLESFQDMLEEVIDQPELMKELNSKFPQWAMRSDYSSLYPNKKNNA